MSVTPGSKLASPAALETLHMTAVGRSSQGSQTSPQRGPSTHLSASRHCRSEFLQSSSLYVAGRNTIGGLRAGCTRDGGTE